MLVRHGYGALLADGRGILVPWRDSSAIAAETELLRDEADHPLHHERAVRASGAAAAVQAIRALRQEGLGVRALQDYYAGIAAGSAS